MIECRTQIIRTYAGWTALSALRSGAPVKSRKQVYGLLRSVDFPHLLAPAGHFGAQLLEFPFLGLEALRQLTQMVRFRQRHSRDPCRNPSRTSAATS